MKISVDLRSCLRSWSDHPSFYQSESVIETHSFFNYSDRSFSFAPFLSECEGLQHVNVSLSILDRSVSTWP